MLHQSSVARAFQGAASVGLATEKRAGVLDRYVEHFDRAKAAEGAPWGGRRRRTGAIFGLVLGLGLLGCNDPGPADAGNMGELARESDVTTGRWYSQAQLESGAGIFQQHCASCHGREAEGLVADWRARQADGSLPPPPLNGSAHAWHHPLPVLLQVINDGGAPYGGKMPAFAEQLSATEKRAVIAYFQDFWDDETYQQWLQMGGIN